MGQRRQNCLVYIWLKGSGHLNCLAYFLGSILLVQKKGEHVACTRTLNGRYHAAIADDVQSAMFTRLVRLGAREGRVIPRPTTMVRHELKGAVSSACQFVVVMSNPREREGLGWRQSLAVSSSLRCC